MINRCLGCMSGLVMLSEIHPGNGNQLNDFNALVQAGRWFDLLTVADKEVLRRQQAENWPDWEFLDSIRLTQQRVIERGAHLLIREFSHADFMQTPRTNPTYRSQVWEHLRGEYHVRRAAVVRHPLDQWRSMQSYRWARNRCTLEGFLYGHRRFAEMSVETGFVRYEDFCRNPAKALTQLCENLNVPFDAAFSTSWANYTKVTGDESRAPSGAILARTRPEPDVGALARLQHSDDYHISLQLLGYTR